MKRAGGDNTGSAMPKERVGRMHARLPIPAGAHKQGPMQAIPRMVWIGCVGCKTHIGRLRLVSCRGGGPGLVIWVPFLGGRHLDGNNAEANVVEPSVRLKPLPDG